MEVGAPNEKLQIASLKSRIGTIKEVEANSKHTFWHKEP
jgi:hypothetical protein